MKKIVSLYNHSQNLAVYTKPAIVIQEAVTVSLKAVDEIFGLHCFWAI